MTQRPHSESHTILEPGNALPEMTFAELPDSMAKAVARAKWNALKPVQARAIPYMIAGRELLVQAPTGSGKTGAFILPILDRIDTRDCTCQALVLVPTRELAQQVADEAARLAGDSGVRIVSVYGGVGYGKQLDGFRAGAHIVVGTPGRILDHLLRASLKLDDLETIVFDEADRMLSLGFYPDMLQIRRYLPKHRKGYMFSATFTPRVKQLAGHFLDNPDFLSLNRDRLDESTTTHISYEVPATDKDRALVRIIELENPDSAIIFCNMKTTVNFVTRVLQRFGYDADQLSADLSQSAREEVLNRVRKGDLQFLVATDIAGRGIDIPELSHVFIYDWPEDAESYVHRAGRTGRAGATGVAISLVDGAEIGMRHNAVKMFSIPIEVRLAPTDAMVEEIVAERTIALLEARLRKRDRLQIERMRRFLPLVKTLSESTEEHNLLAMLLDDYYQQAHHDRPAPPEPEPRPASKPRSNPEPSREPSRESSPRPAGGSSRGRRIRRS